MIKAFIRAVCVALGQIIMALLAKQFSNLQILSMMKFGKFTQTCISQRHHNEEASIETTREQSVIAKSQLPATG